MSIFLLQHRTIEEESDENLKINWSQDLLKIIHVKYPSYIEYKTKDIAEIGKN